MSVNEQHVLDCHMIYPGTVAEAKKIIDQLQIPWTVTDGSGTWLTPSNQYHLTPEHAYNMSEGTSADIDPVFKVILTEEQMRDQLILIKEASGHEISGIVYILDDPADEFPLEEIHL